MLARVVAAVSRDRCPCRTAALESQRGSADCGWILDLLEETATMTGQIKLSSALLTFAAALLAATLFLSGCNTAEGVGDDVEEAGDEVEDAVD